MRNLDKKQKLGVLGVYFLLVSFSFFYPNILIVVISRVLMATFALLVPSLGLSMWVASSMLDSYLENQFNFNVSFMTVSSNIAMLSGLTIYFFVVNGKMIAGKKIAGYFVVFAFFVFVSFFINLNLAQISAYVALFINMLVFLFINWIIYCKKDTLGMIFVSIIFSGIILIFISVFGSDSATWRLSIDGNVRIVANVVGFGLVGLIGCFLDSENAKKISSFLSNKIIILILVVLFLCAILLGLSRGILVTIICSSVIMMILNLSNLSKLNKVKFITLCFCGGFVLVYFSVVFFANNPLFLKYITENPLENLRILIWLAGIRQLHGWQWLWGAGVGQFRELAMANGFDFYSHSIYVDVLVSLGIIGLFCFMILILSIGFNLFKQKNVIGAGIYCYCVIAFSTHGHLNSRIFWIALAIAHSLSCKRQFKY